MSVLKSFCATVALSVWAVSAGAATISVSIFDAATYNGSFGSGANIGEDFEALGASKGEGEVGVSLATAVGTFSTIGGVGSGGTVTQLSGNTGHFLALRDGNVFGRDNATPTGGAWFLDSNDTYGMIWDVALNGGLSFTKLQFVLSDASDVGAYLRITTGTDSRELRTGGKLPNGSDQLVEIDFGGAVTSAQVILGNYSSMGGTTYKRNDGFSIDGIQVRSVPGSGGENPPPVPLPASVVLLAAGLASLGAVARRRKAA